MDSALCTTAELQHPFIHVHSIVFGSRVEGLCPGIVASCWPGRKFRGYCRMMTVYLVYIPYGIRDGHRWIIVVMKCPDRQIEGSNISRPLIIRVRASANRNDGSKGRTEFSRI